MHLTHFHLVIRPVHTMEDRDQLLLAAQLLLDDDRLQNEAAARDAAEDSDSNDGDGYDDDGGGDGDAPSKIQRFGYIRELYSGDDSDGFGEAFWAF